MPHRRLPPHLQRSSMVKSILAVIGVYAVLAAAIVGFLGA